MSQVRLLSDRQFDAARGFVWTHGRLLERQLWRVLFEGAPVEVALCALRAYQNADGGFGNGLEPDLLCPASSGIAAETALWHLWLLGNPDPALAAAIAVWTESALDERGAIRHPPAGLGDYPHQPWWAGADDHRVLAVAALLHLLRVEAPGLMAAATRLCRTLPPPAPEAFYSYPELLFAHTIGSEVIPTAADWLVHLPTVLVANRTHLPLFSRSWFWAQPLVDRATLNAAAQQVVGALQEDGGLADLYPALPWWRPLFTLDALALLKLAGY